MGFKNRPYIYSGNFSTQRNTSAYNWTNAFTGQYYDNTTGLMLYRNRYYHPTLGRFITRDMIKYSAGANLYSYVFNNSPMLLDTSGMISIGGILASSGNITSVGGSLETGPWPTAIPGLSFYASVSGKVNYGTCCESCKEYKVTTLEFTISGAGEYGASYKKRNPNLPNRKHKRTRGEKHKDRAKIDRVKRENEKIRRAREEASKRRTWEIGGIYDDGSCPPQGYYVSGYVSLNGAIGVGIIGVEAEFILSINSIDQNLTPSANVRTGFGIGGASIRVTVSVSGSYTWKEPTGKEC